MNFRRVLKLASMTSWKMTCAMYKMFIYRAWALGFRICHWALSGQGQGHGATLKLFPFSTIQTVRAITIRCYKLGS